MNENIENLIEQAIVNAPFECASYTKRQWLETFTALIIENCIKEVEKNYVGFYGSHASAHNSAVKKCVETLKEQSNGN